VKSVWLGRAAREHGIDVLRVEAVRAVTELARHRHRALLPENIVNLPGSEGAQESGDAARAAAALEAHGRAAEEPQVVIGKAPREQLLRARAEQLGGAEPRDATLGSLLGGGQLVRLPGRRVG